MFRSRQPAARSRRSPAAPSTTPTSILRAADGNEFAAFRTRASRPTGAGIVILPDVRGLYSFYEELALRFAEAGIDALAFDYFGRTAGVAKRDAEFSYMEHVQQTTLAELRADVTAAGDELRRDGRVKATFTIGFCFGGRLSYSTATFGLDLAGSIAFYGMPVGDRPGYPGSDRPSRRRWPTRSSASSAAPTRRSRPRRSPSSRAALDAAVVEHELVTYPGRAAQLLRPQGRRLRRRGRRLVDPQPGLHRGPYAAG